MHWFPFRVSRPRFWFYLFGPYLVGQVAAVSVPSEMIGLLPILFAFYFLFPANLLVYGINDIFDYETDKLNEKKSEYETLVTPSRRAPLLIWITVTNLPFMIAAALFAPSAMPALIAFLFLSVFYSAPPIRAKTKPFLDSAFNILYVFPGVFGYNMITGTWPPPDVIIAAGLWTAAMHAYSAIPDITADREAGLRTVATVLGPYGTLALCAALYLSSAVLSTPYLGFVSVSLGAAYLILMLASFRSVRTGTLFRLYRAFPMINVVAGFIIFWHAALTRETVPL